MKHRTGARRVATGLIALSGFFGLAGVATVPVASAHDAVVGGTPTDGQTLSEFPQAITLDFSAEPKAGFNTMAVTDQGGTVLFSGEPTLNGNLLTLAVPADVHPGDGSYNVGFQITSSDGHATRGKISFTVSGSGSEAASGTSSTSESATATSSSDAQQASNDSSNSGLLWGLGAAIVIVLAAVVALLRRKKS
ncbi:copper resistance CopC family protein [Corynebacterium vitaeruminis]|uniref:copper resistance CopC family protein n=1 Tax=Corynebacterium vitaeruminis TaxID=38305 RepID=UPI0023F724B0|nr:copper resistance CopC family protein [Corynebacterium vitaeruminis]